jgi:hypothetical protein
MAQVNITKSGGKAAATDISVALVAATTPFTFDNDGQTYLNVVVGATPTNLTPTQIPCTHGRTNSAAIALAANKTYMLGPFPREEFNDGNGQFNGVFSSIATVTVAAIRQP